MREHVTIIPNDGVMIVDGAALNFDFQAPDNVHAIQWRNGAGHIEYTDGRRNEELAEADYDGIASLVALWEAEKARLDEIANTPPTGEELAAQRLTEIDARLVELDSASVRPLRALVDGSATEDDTAKLAAIEQEAEALRVERVALTADV